MSNGKKIKRFVLLSVFVITIAATAGAAMMVAVDIQDQASQLIIKPFYRLLG